MDCKNIKEVIPAYIMHSATEDEVKIVEEHLCVCNDCRLFLGECLDKQASGEKLIKEPKGQIKSVPAPNKVGFLEYLVIAAGIAILVILVILFFIG